MNLELNRIDSFWANALHKEVFPVPGGPCKRTMLKEHENSQKVQISRAYQINYLQKVFE